MQHEKTRQFWDEYHAENPVQEWIVQPTPTLFQLIQSYFPSDGTHNDSSDRQDKNPTNTLSILEVGCGTSTLAREFWLYLNSPQNHKYPNQTYHVCATDVSPICVQVCSDRDKNIMKANIATNVEGENKPTVQLSENTRPTRDPTLVYETLNVLEPPTSHIGSWDVILDKACMDTFLFRSRQRGQNRDYSNVVRTALDSIWSMLSSAESDDDDVAKLNVVDDKSSPATKARNGVYILISPRSKVKAIRDYSGFRSVQRLPMSFSEHVKASIANDRKGRRQQQQQKKNRKDKDGVENETHKNEKDNYESDEDEPCYMYICQKNPDYVVGQSKPFKSTYRDLPSDNTTCPHCQLKFGDLRNGEDVQGRGVVFWTRQWKSHCIHCKAPHQSKFSN